MISPHNFATKVFANSCMQDEVFNASLHADQVQGFYFGKPVPASEIGANILKAYRKTAAGEADAKLRIVKQN